MYTRTTVTADLTMCADCAHMYVNGIDEHDDNQRAHMLVAFEHTKEWTGTIVIGEHTDEFSARECDTCGTTDAGDRYSGSLLESVRVRPLVRCHAMPTPHIHTVLCEHSTLVMIDFPRPEWKRVMAGSTTTSRFD